MKSAEEWTDTDLNRAIFAYGDEVYKVVKARDLEMWKQGMTAAAAIAQANHREASSISFLYKAEVEGLINAVRDQTKSV